MYHSSATSVNEKDAEVIFILHFEFLLIGKSNGLAGRKELKKGEAKYMKKILQLLPSFMTFIHN